jgi:mono/diheme cytochrome c family protein
MPPEGIHPDAGRGAAGLPIPPGTSKEQVLLGAQIFHGEVADGICAGCHGSSGRGSPVGANLTSGPWLWGDGSLGAIAKTIQQGVPHPKQAEGAMPPMGGVALTPEQLQAVAAYVWAIGQHKTH